MIDTLNNQREFVSEKISFDFLFLIRLLIYENEPVSAGRRLEWHIHQGIFARLSFFIEIEFLNQDFL